MIGENSEKRTAFISCKKKRRENSIIITEIVWNRCRKKRVLAFRCGKISARIGKKSQGDTGMDFGREVSGIRDFGEDFFYEHVESHE